MLKHLVKYSLLGVLFLGAVVTGALFSLHNTTSAMPPHIGGRSFVVGGCANGGFLISVIGPRPGLFVVLVPPASIIHMNYQFEGSNVLGDVWAPGAFCVVGTSAIPAMGYVRHIGTSVM